MALHDTHVRYRYRILVGVLCDSNLWTQTYSEANNLAYDQKRTEIAVKTSVRAENDLERARNQVARGFIFCAEKPP